MLRVTEALTLAGLVDAQWFTEASSARGTAVHAACALDDAGDLDESTVHPAVAPYLSGWRRFRAEMQPEILTIEEGVRHEPYRYRGTLDRRMKLRGIEGVGDIKTGAPLASHPIQLAAYALTFDRPLARWGIYLREDGSYRIEECRDRRDFDVWKAVITVANFIQEHKA
jgi:hypothetical protein